MEEEKKKRKISKEEKEPSPQVEEYEVSAPVKNKKKFIVVLVNSAIVVYKVGENSNSVTKNIWGNSLKPGDEIYL